MCKIYAIDLILPTLIMTTDFKIIITIIENDKKCLENEL